MTKMSFCREQIHIEPQVKAFRVLIRSPRIKANSTGLSIPEQVLQREMVAFNIGLVLAIGPMCFTGAGEPYKAEIGEWVWYSNYERQDLYHPEFNCYHINDDRILSSVLPEDLEYLLTKNKAGKYE